MPCVRGARKAAAVAPAPSPVAAKRGRGRPKATVTPVAIVQETPKKRGCPAKAKAAEVAASTPKANDKKARTPEQTKKCGRPVKDTIVATRASPRIKKPSISVPDVASSRATKTRGRLKKTATPKPAPVAPPRVNARMRSKLRNRKQLLDTKLAHEAADKARAHVPVRKRRGRPAKKAPAPAAAPKKGARVARDAVQKKAKREYMTITVEIPKKFAVQLQQTVLDLEAAFEAEKAQDQDTDVAIEEAEVTEEPQEDLTMADDEGNEGLTRSTEEISIEEDIKEEIQGDTAADQVIETHVEVSDFEEMGDETQQEQESVQQILMERDER